MYVVSVKIEDLAVELSRRNSIQGALVDARLDGDVLSIYLKPLDRGAVESHSESGAASGQPSVGAHATVATRLTIPKRRARRRRNRMRTRGWSVVGQVTNKYGQTANVYQPLVDALKDITLTSAEQKSLVAKILRSNGNNPSPESVAYFLEKTLQYLKESHGYDTGNV
jgi:hypothetical protein